MFRDFVTALQFLTVIRVRRRHAASENELARSMVYFPFVGFAIGFLLVKADQALLWLLPDTISNVIIVLLWTAVSGGLHIDGLADTADGLMGGRDPEQRLAIMRDSRIGTAGVLAILFALLLKYAVLNSLFDDAKTAALLTAPAFARWSQMLMMFEASYGREEGLGKAFIGHVRFGGLLAASVVSIGLSAFVIYENDTRTALLAAGVPVAVAVLTLLWRWFAGRKIGGVTGDTVGAANELNEVLTLLLFVFLLARP